MTFKRILLFIAAVFIILFYFKTDYYSVWLDTRVLNVKEQFLNVELDSQGYDFRRQYRYGGQYVLAKQLVQTMIDSGDAKGIILLPPNAYLKENSPRISANLNMPEPVVFYYYTGAKAVWTNSPDVRKATWALTIDHDRVGFDRIRSQQQLDQILSIYKNYKPEL